MVEKGDKRRIQILFLLLACSIIALQPVALSGPTYWDVSTDWSFYSGTGATSGPVSFSNDFTCSQIQITGGLVKFANLVMGYSWADIGFSCDTPTASITVTGIESSEIRYTVNAPSGTISTTKVYVGGKGCPADVLNVRNWNYTDSTNVVLVQVAHSSPADIVLRWTGSNGGGSGTTPPETTPPEDAISPIGPTGIFSWFYQNPSITIALGVIAFLVWNSTRRPDEQKRKKKTMDLVMPDLDNLKDTTEEWKKKMKKSVWR